LLKRLGLASITTVKSGHVKHKQLVEKCNWPTALLCFLATIDFPCTAFTLVSRNFFTCMVRSWCNIYIGTLHLSETHLLSGHKMKFNGTRASPTGK